MKLSAQYNRATLIITLLVLLIAGFIYYTTINYIVNKQLDRDLTEELSELAEQINTTQQLPDDLDENETTFTKADKPTSEKSFFNTPYHNKKKGNKTEPGRAVSSGISFKGNNYTVTIIESKESSENLIQVIIGITLLLTAILIGVLIVVNTYVLSGLWKPFYYTLHELKAFNIADGGGFRLNKTRIDEFTELNNAVMTMSSKVKNDYQNLKTFTENVSHEMLTPIAVITSKLDTLIQDEKLKAEHFEQINDIYTATNKLSRVNQLLLLLVKIDNNLIQDNTTFNLKDILLEKTQQFNELAQNRQIEVTHILDDKETTASRYLIEILINNLFNNAIKHNIPDGNIYINLTANQLEFQNTGEREALNKDEIFERFKKGKHSDGTGLGLTIAKNICQQYHYKLSYKFEAPMHIFKITF